MQPTEVNHPWELILELPNQNHKVLPDQTTILQVFQEEAARLLLVLGKPGSGKTMTTIELAKELIEQVRQNKQQIIPVMFNLSSWATQQKSLLLWLVDELNNKYQIPKELGEFWLKQHYLLPLLDGLDEVCENVRADCVKEINTFAKEAGITGLVVCCREDEYRELPEKLNLNAAISLQPLKQDQIESYIKNAGGRLQGLSQILAEDGEMRAMASSPLMLGIMSLTYNNMTVEKQVIALVMRHKVSYLIAILTRCFCGEKQREKYFQMIK